MGSLTQVVEDCFGVLKLYSDGTVDRAHESDIDFGSFNVDNHDISGEGCGIEWEDCMFDDQHQLNLRVYKPYSSTSSGNNIKVNDNNKMAILYFIHGGGFCLGSRTWPNCHYYCLRLSSQLQALVIASDYRLAPEDRLPAAIEDGLNAVKWLQEQAKSVEKDITAKGFSACSRLLDDGVDFSKVFIVGDSSGGNIAHHIAVQLGFGSPALSPVRVRGYVLLAPFFGGSLRTKSETGPPEPILNLESLDRFWRLCLPIGESRDHPIANPFGPNSPSLEKVKLDPILVVVGSKEIMKDRVDDYATRLTNLGKNVTYMEFEGQHHGFFMHDPFSQASSQLLQLLNRFIRANEVSC